MKKITVFVSSSELNALEDLLWCELGKKDLRKAARLSKNLWGRLVKAFDRKRK